MKLPNLSFMMRLGQLRYVQATYERGGCRNPDLMVRELLHPLDRLRCDVRARIDLRRLRAAPFYRYVIARTKYYDAVFLDAVAMGCTHIVNIGCGSDTRAYRFAHILEQKGMRVLECDQPDAIRAKEQLLRGRWPTGHVEYLPLDLNEPGVPELKSRLEQVGGGRVLVMLEGVSPYVEGTSWDSFLDMVSTTLPPGSHLAYDYKLDDVAVGFGVSEGTRTPFRLPASRQEVDEHHRRHRLRLVHMESSTALTKRLVPDNADWSSPPFEEDVLLRLAVD